jgi:hypothetical protein
VEETWTAVPQPMRGSLAELAQQLAQHGGAPPIAGHRVVQTVKAQKPGFAHLHGQELREHLLSIGVQTNDDVTYSGSYATIRGTDVSRDGDKVLRGRPAYDANGHMLHDGVIRQSTEIRGGRAEYNRVLKEKGYGVWDQGWHAHAARIRAERLAKMQAKHAIEVEKRDCLMPRLVGEL